MDKAQEKAVVKHYSALYKQLGSYGVYIIATRHAGGFILGDSVSLVQVDKSITLKLPWLHLVPETGDVRFTKDGATPWTNANFGSIQGAWDKWSNADASPIILTPFSVDADGKTQLFLTPENEQVLVPCKHLDMVTAYLSAYEFAQLKSDHCPVRVHAPGGAVRAIIMPLDVKDSSELRKFAITQTEAA